MRLLFKALLLTLFGLCCLSNHGQEGHRPSPQTVSNLALRIATATRQFDRVVRDISAVLIAVLKQIDADPTALESQKARQILTELHAEIAELTRQSGRLIRDDFGKQFMQLYQSGTGNLEAFIRAENGRLLSLFKLSGRCDEQFQALLREFDSNSKKQHDSFNFFEGLIEGHWRIVAIAILTCFLFYPWRTAAAHSILFIVLYALILQYLHSIDNTAHHFFNEFSRFKEFGLSSLLRGFKDAFRFKKPSARSALFATAASFESLRDIRQAVSYDFDILIKGIDVSLRREKTILSYLESATNPTDYDSQRVINLMRNNPFNVPRMQFDDLRQRDDKAIAVVVQAADRLETKAIEATDSIYHILSGGLESILTAEAVINQARLLTGQSKFADAAELASIVAGKYSQLEAAFSEVLDNLHSVQSEFESVQSARKDVISKYRRKKISSGLMLTASIAAVVSGLSLPLIGSMGTAAIGAATAGSATVTMLTSENVLAELHQFGNDLSGFREALSKIRQMVIGSQTQLGSVSELLYLIQDDLRNLGLEYEPIDRRVKEGLELFFKEALEEQAELTSLLNLAPKKKSVTVDIISSK